MKNLRFNNFRYFKIFISLLLIGVSKFAYPAIWCVYHPILGLGCGYSEQSCSELGGEDGFSNQGNYYLLCISFSNEEVLNTSNILFVDQTNQAVLEVGGKRINVVSDKENIFLKKLFKEYDPERSAEVKKQLSDFDRIDDGIVSESRLDKIAKKFNAKIVRVNKLPEADYCPGCDEETANALDLKYKNLQASIIQLNFAKSSFAVQKSQEKVLRAYASYLQRAINQEGIPAGTPKIGGNDPIEGIDIIIKKDPSSRPIANPGNDPTVNEVNRLEKAYLAFKLKELKENYEKDVAGKMTYEEYLAQEIAQAEKEKNALPPVESYESSNKTPSKDKQGTKKTNNVTDKPTSKISKVKRVAMDGFTPDVPKFIIYTGSSHPIGEFYDFSKTGIDIGVSAELWGNKVWHFGFDYNRQMNGFKLPSKRFNWPAEQGPRYTITTTQSGSWVTNTFGFGSTYYIRFGDKLTSGLSNRSKFLALYAIPGVSLIQSPEAVTRLDVSFGGGNQSSINMFELSKQNQTVFGVTTGARFHFPFGKGHSFFVNPQYVYTAGKIDYTYLDLSSNIFGIPGGAYTNGQFDPTLALESPTREAEINPNYFNFNVGVCFGIGQKKPKGQTKGFGPTQREARDYARRDREKEKQKEQGIVPVHPPNNVHYSDSREITKLTWTLVGKTIAKPQFRLTITSLENGKQVYDGIPKTKGGIEVGSAQFEVEWPDIMPQPLPTGVYQWKVVEVNTGLTSNTRSFTVNPCNIAMSPENIELECRGFEEGKRKITICFDNKYGPSNVADLTYSESTSGLFVTDGAGNTINYNLIGTSLQSQSANITSTVNYCLELLVDLNVTILNVRLQGDNFYLNQPPPGCTPMTYMMLDSLPNCICDVCDDWKYDFSNKQVTQVNSSWGNLALNQTISIAEAQPIQKVTAEVVFVKNNIKNPECYTCTKDDNRMGLFARKANSGKITTNPTEWQNDGLGSLTDENEDLYGNQYTWCVASEEGVDFTNPKNFKLSLNLPEISSLECCKSSYEICIRYTFTDIDCKTCSKVVCYSFEPTSPSGDIIIEEQNDERKNK